MHNRALKRAVATAQATVRVFLKGIYHRYHLDEQGMILDARIVPPTSQNQKTIEGDLRELVSQHMDAPKDQLTWQCEQAIRNYDPCISCATHFLKLTIERE
jgi:sulfhydrogenase subunit alpha